MDRTTDYIEQLEITKDTITKPENQRNTVRKILGEATMEGCDAAEIARAAAKLFPWFDPLKVPAPVRSASADASASEYLEGDIYMEIASIPDEMERVREKALHKAKAKKAGIGAREFEAMYKAAEAKLKAEKDTSAGQSVLDIDGVPHRLPGRYARTDAGEIVEVETGAIVCPHDICVTARVKNLTSDEYSVQLAYKRDYDTEWSYAYIDGGTVSNKSKILELKPLYDISVISKRADDLTEFLDADYEAHRETLPQKLVVDKMGWIDGEFVPYSKKIEFSGTPAYKHICESTTPKGDLETWKKEMLHLLNTSHPAAKIMLATAAASPLIRLLQVPGWTTHVEGSTSKGKSALLQAVASMWGNPKIGYYTTSYSDTQVGVEAGLGVRGSMPLMIDEYSVKDLSKDKLKDASRMVYIISLGAGKSRGTRTGGLQKARTWDLTCVSTGEDPILLDGANGGAQARLLSIHLAQQDGQVCEDPIAVYKTFQRNYGFAGRAYVEWLQANPGAVADADECKTEIFERLKAKGIQEKHALIGATLMAAASLLSEAMGWEDSFLECKDLIPYLLTKEAISREETDWQWLIGWITEIQNRLLNGDDDHDGKINSAVGKIDDCYIYIINTALSDACTRAGINKKTLIRWGVETGKIEPGADGKPTKTKYIGETSPRCVWIKKDSVLAEFDEIPPEEAGEF